MYFAININKYNFMIQSNFIDSLKKAIRPFHLLNHPFYQDWNKGKLNLEVLREYSKQYYHHVETFPRCISAIHSNCADLKNRQILLGNLMEEEDKKMSHPDLWIKFAKGLNVKESEIKNINLNKETKELINGFFIITRSSYTKGLGALYAYEYQVPDVSESKIKGLAEFYGVKDKETIKFFTVHIEVDKWHSEESLGLLKQLNSQKEQSEAIEGAKKLSSLMWNFLSGIEKQTKHLIHRTI